MILPPPGPHGGDGPAVARALGLDPCDVVDLSRPTNPSAPDVAALAARHLGSLRTYPDPTAAHAHLAAAMGVAAERLLLTNGGAEAIALVAAEVGGSVLVEPEFGLHPRRRSRPRWRSDPHSPSGLLAQDDLRADVWDEAHYPLTTGRWSAGRDGIALGSLTKLYDCPGLRLGYVVADGATVARLAARQPTWAVGSLALAVLPDLLAATDLPGWAATTAAARDATAEVLRAHGLATSVADAPWVLVRAPGLRERLAPHGVVVRDCASFGLDGWVRVAAADASARARLDAALAVSPPLPEPPPTSLPPLPFPLPTPAPAPPPTPPFPPPAPWSRP